jgi:hypothetical protein
MICAVVHVAKNFGKWGYHSCFVRYRTDDSLPGKYSSINPKYFAGTVTAEE